MQAPQQYSTYVLDRRLLQPSAAPAPLLAHNLRQPAGHTTFPSTSNLGILPPAIEDHLSALTRDTPININSDQPPNTPPMSQSSDPSNVPQLTARLAHSVVLPPRQHTVAVLRLDTRQGGEF